jgi:hypothetical protein
MAEEKRINNDGRSGFIMTKKKRMIMIEENLNKIRYFREVKTQELRVKLIAELEKPSTEALNIAGSAHTENRDDRPRSAPTSPRPSTPLVG